MNKALDYGHDSGTVLACLASTVSTANQTAPTAASSCVQLVEFLMSYVSSAHDKGEEIREIPESVLELVSETMGAAYPPAPREKTQYLWAARAVREVVEKCPPVLGEFMLVGDVIKGIMDGVAVWIEDETEVWSLEELEYDVSVFLCFAFKGCGELTCVVAAGCSALSIHSCAYTRATGYNRYIEDVRGIDWMPVQWAGSRTQDVCGVIQGVLGGYICANRGA